MSSSRLAAYRITGFALAICGAVLFSFKSILIKLAYGYQVDPVTLIALRMIFSLPFFIGVALWSRRDRSQAPLSRHDAAAILALGFSGYYASSFLDFLSLQFVSASLERLILFLYPTMVLLISVLFLKRRASRREFVALAISYAGIALVFLHDLASGVTNRDLGLGGALVFASALLYAMYLIAGTDVISRVGSARFTAYAMTVACLCVIAQFLLLHPLAKLELPWQVYAYGAAIAVLSTVLPIFMTSEALKRIGAMKVSMLGALGPVATIFGDVWIMGAPVSMLQIGGSALVLAGVFVISTKPGNRHNFEGKRMFLGLRTAIYQVPDIGKAKQWYAKVLGIAPYFDQPFYVGFNVGGYELGLQPDAPAGTAVENVVAYWGVKDAQAALDHLLAAGATLKVAVQDVGEGIKVATVHDPYGNVFGVIENPHFAAA